MSCQHLHLVVTWLPCPGCHALSRLCAVLVAGLHHPSSKNQRSYTNRRPSHGTRGPSHPHTGKGQGYLLKQIDVVDIKAENA